MLRLGPVMVTTFEHSLDSAATQLLDYVLRNHYYLRLEHPHVTENEGLLRSACTSLRLVYPFPKPEYPRQVLYAYRKTGPLALRTFVPNLHKVNDLRDVAPAHHVEESANWHYLEKWISCQPDKENWTIWTKSDRMTCTVEQAFLLWKDRVIKMSRLRSQHLGWWSKVKRLFSQNA